MKWNQKGFSAVEGLLIVLVLAVVGFGGYYVFQSKDKDTSKTPISNANESSDKDSPQDNLTSETQELKISALGVKINDPDNRQLQMHAEKICAAECAEEDSYFIRDNNDDYFDRCEYPAGISKLDEAGIQDITARPTSYTAKHSKKIGSNYYYVFPGSSMQSVCAQLQDGDEEYEEEIRQYILDNLEAL